MSELELLDSNDDVSVTVSFDHVAEKLGQQYILGDEDDPEFAYLAALALETRDSRYSIEDTLMEYLRNSSEFEHLTAEQCDTIEGFLR